MPELTNRIETDLVLDKKLDAGRFDGADLKNYVASQELTVTITLNEYRNLVSGIATKKFDIDLANKDKYARESEIKAVKEANEKLKSENYDLKCELDELKQKLDKMQTGTVEAKNA